MVECPQVSIWTGCLNFPEFTLKRTRGDRTVWKHVVIEKTRSVYGTKAHYINSPSGVDTCGGGDTMCKTPVALSRSNRITGADFVGSSFDFTRQHFALVSSSLVNPYKTFA